MNVNQEWDTNSIKHYKTVQQIKKQLRKGNWNYLNHHPEIRAILRVLLHEALNKRPTNIYRFASKLFNCNNTRILKIKVNDQLKRVNIQLKKSRWGDFDGEPLFKEAVSTHSLLSRTSMPEHVHALLKYAMLVPTMDR